MTKCHIGEQARIQILNQGADDIRFARSVLQLFCVLMGLCLYAPPAVRITEYIQTIVTHMRTGKRSKIGTSLNGR